MLSLSLIDAAGIVTSENGKLNLRKDNGLVAEVFQQHHVIKLRVRRGPRCLLVYDVSWMWCGRRGVLKHYVISFSCFSITYRATTA